MRPPHHRIGAQLRIIDLGDPAFDDRFNAEIAPLDLAEAAEHPILLFRRGETHFDLDAPGWVVDEDGERRQACAREYLRPGAVPKVFVARRLDPAELATCLDLGENGGRAYAFRIAVRRIEGAPELAYEVAEGKAATDRQLRAVGELLGGEAVLRVGRMVIDASRRPTPAEGKPSGSSPGAPSPATGVSPAESAPGSASATA